MSIPDLIKAAAETYAFELSRITLASQDSHIERNIKDFRRSAHASVKESGTDDVDTGEFAPFVGQRFCEMRECSFGAVIYSL